MGAHPGLVTRALLVCRCGPSDLVPRERPAPHMGGLACAGGPTSNWTSWDWVGTSHQTRGTGSGPADAPGPRGVNIMG